MLTSDPPADRRDVTPPLPWLHAAPAVAHIGKQNVGSGLRYQVAAVYPGCECFGSGGNSSQAFPVTAVEDFLDPTCRAPGWILARGP